METKDRIEAYLKEALWADVKLRPYRGVVDSEEVISRYTLWRVQGLSVEFVLMVRQPGHPNPSACVLARDIDLLRERIPMWVAYGTDVMSPTERNRLIRRRIPFVSAGRQIYLLFLGLALCECRCPHPAKWLGVAAQHLLLAALRGEIAGPMSDLTGEHIANCSRATVYRAFGELESFGLVRRTFHGQVFIEGLSLMLAELQPRLKRSAVREALEHELDRLLLS